MISGLFSLRSGRHRLAARPFTARRYSLIDWSDFVFAFGHNLIDEREVLANKP